MTDEAADLLVVALPPTDPEGATLQSVIKDFKLVETMYTTAFLYAVNQCHYKAKDYLDIVDRESYTKHFLNTRRSFESLDNNIRKVWENKHYSHLLRQPQIMDKIISALKKNSEGLLASHPEKNQSSIGSVTQ
jgi:hypothetical protein